MSNVSLVLRKPKAVNVNTLVLSEVENCSKRKLLPFFIVQFFISAYPWALGYHYVVFIMPLAADVVNKLELMR